MIASNPGLKDTQIDPCTLQQLAVLGAALLGVSEEDIHTQQQESIKGISVPIAAAGTKQPYPKKEQTCITQSKVGIKHDCGKIRPALVLGGFSKALTAVSAVGTFGASKYTENGWKLVPDARQRYSDALLRHLLKGESELYDSESGLLHYAHAAWNALAVLHFIIKEEELKTGKPICY